ncbi:LamG domain-containing protein, partial [Akkermansiaceae bacterium]|nr:LamG domain-containing protein [Akkermansiaceae bacterium]
EVIVADLKPHHFGVVWDHDHGKGLGEMRLFLDGQQVATQELSHAGLSSKQANPLRIGAKGNPDRLALDELRFSARALSPHEFLLRLSVAGVTMTRSDKNNRNSWAVPEYWEKDTLPGGADNVILGRGITVQLENEEVPEFSGALVLRDQANLILWGDKALSLLPENPAKLILHRDARLVLRTGNAKFGPVEMVANAEIWGGASTSGHRGTRQFLAPITGPGMLTVNGVNKNTIIFEAPNSFTGGLKAYSSQKQAFRVMAKGKGTLGKGDVTIGDFCSLILEKDSGNVIESSATLSLEGSNGSMPQKLVLNSGESVGAFVIDGKDQGVGTFSAKTHKEIGGTGTLKVMGLK